MAAFGLGVAFVVTRYTVRTPFLSPDTMPPEIQMQREIDVERLRVRLRGMTDEQLRQFGKAARYMISTYANNGKPPLEAFVIQWQEARADGEEDTQKVQARSIHPPEALRWKDRGGACQSRHST
jgi:hypothetical protein